MKKVTYFDKLYVYVCVCVCVFAMLASRGGILKRWKYILV